MRECAVCHTKSEDHAMVCPKCGADLRIDSLTARALRDILASPRASAVFVVAPAHACPSCRRAQGTFYKDTDRIPEIPIEGCSCPDGCTCRYEPLVNEPGP
jgi:hypothetical protein